MKKIILFLLSFFTIVPVTSFALSDNSQVDLNCYMVTNNSSEQVWYQFQDGQGGWNWDFPEYAYLPIGNTVFFTNPSHNNSYNPRVIDSQGNGFIYPGLDCRDGLRTDPPQAWIDHNTPPPPPPPTPPACNSMIYGLSIPLSSFSESTACDVGNFSSYSPPAAGPFQYSCLTSEPASASCHVTLTVSNEPQNITGYFSTPVYVASGSYNWNMTLNLSQSGHIDAIQDIQLWNAFHVDSATTNGDTIVLALSPTISPLAVPCGVYTVNVPGSLIQGNDGISANQNGITGSFSITSCPESTNTGSTNTGSTNSGAWVPPSASGSYLAFTYYDTRTGTTYIDFWALISLAIYLSGILAIFYGLFLAYKNRFLGKK